MLVKILNNSWSMEEIEVEITCYLQLKARYLSEATVDQKLVSCGENHIQRKFCSMYYCTLNLCGVLSFQLMKLDEKIVYSENVGNELRKIEIKNLKIH